MILLGEPGSGKTWAMRHLALTQANACLRGDHSDHFPIYAELRDWHIPLESADERPPKVEVFRFLWKVLQQFQPDLSLLEPNEYQAILEEAFQGRPFTLILDGLDEIRDPVRRNSFAYSLVDFLEDFEGVGHRYVIATREYGFRAEISEIFRNNGFEIFEMTKKPAAEVKRKILNAYLPDLPEQVSSSQVLDVLTSNYRLERLSDNVLLMNILAEHYQPGFTPPQTRGLLLKKRADSYIAAVTNLPGEHAKEFMIRLATVMRQQQRRGLKELQEVIPMIQELLHKFPLKKTKYPDDYLELALHTKLIKRREAIFNEISFELPQYEEYFLACKVFIDLEQSLSSDSKAMELPYIQNNEWHHVLILAAGLLEQKDVERLAGILDDDQFLFLKARILGEAIAPVAEVEFIEELRRRLKDALDGALTGLSRRALSALALWWLGIFLLSFVLSWLWDKHFKLAVSVFVGYLVGIPLSLRFVYPRLFQRQVDKVVQGSLPDVLSAWACLRTGVVGIELKDFRRRLNQKLPLRRPWTSQEEEEKDLFVKFVKSVIREIDHALDIAQQPLDAVQNQIEGNPLLIHHWLNSATKAFSPNEVEILEWFLNRPDSLLKMQLKCVRKLRDVAVSEEPLKDQILDVLEDIILQSNVHPRLVSSSKKAKVYILRYRPGPPLSRTIVFWSILVASFSLLDLLAARYAAGENFWQKVNDFWVFYVCWFMTMLVLAQYLLHPASTIRGFFRRLKEPKL